MARNHSPIRHNVGETRELRPAGWEHERGEDAFVERLVDGALKIPVTSIQARCVGLDHE